ncbi:hypothetical protein Ndes2526B_g08817 [Nannochloris sp. 'desiccata']|nr:hypothetical protein KSW81_001614 [Chlorella desiccata (nom. nud.)]KAH7616721.1 hypothetical protein NADE_001529 [Chlorella desiccata (nom. nud.)]
MAEDQEMQDADGNVIVVEVNDEDHTFGNMLRDAMWTHPHVTVAQYTQEEVIPGNQLLIQCQTTDAITAEQGMVESLHIMKEMFITIGDEMDNAMKKQNQKRR